MQDKCRGSLIGGAIGDALGYEVEFMSLAAILKRFGEKGITHYVKHHGVALFSDDTQMTLFTAEGLLNGVKATKAGRPELLLPYIKDAYLVWYKTQTEFPHTVEGSPLSQQKELWSRRAPGNTCMSALSNLAKDIPVKNNSKGCGGVMRVAPIGIFNAAHSNVYSYEDTAHLAGWSAKLTHCHIASTFASALLATTVENCIQDKKVGRTEFGFIVTGGLMCLQEYFADPQKPHEKHYFLYGDYNPVNPTPHEHQLQKFTNLIKRALELGESDLPEREAIRELGEGWVGDEALAIAIFSVMRHIDSFEDCIVCAVNHDGDSDSTGAIAGNIIGAILGYSAIPQHYLDDLEMAPVLLSVADQLASL